MRRSGLRGTIVPTLDQALKSAEDAETVVVTGSFHTVGDAMSLLQLSPLTA